jgi:hypothetical protein
MMVQNSALDASSRILHSGETEPGEQVVAGLSSFWAACPCRKLKLEHPDDGTHPRLARGTRGSPDKQYWHRDASITDLRTRSLRHPFRYLLRGPGVPHPQDPIGSAADLRSMGYTDTCHIQTLETLINVFLVVNVQVRCTLIEKKHSRLSAPCSAFRPWGR